MSQGTMNHSTAENSAYVRHQLMATIENAPTGHRHYYLKRISDRVE